MSRARNPRGGDDRVYTPPGLAHAIVEHFKPTGVALEPCAGKGVFVHAMARFETVTQVHECEIDNGQDFLSWEGKADWIITNPPWGQLREFLQKSMSVANNVVFLCCSNAIFLKARMRDIQQAGFGIKEIAMIPDVPKDPWPQSGFCLAAHHFVKGWKGDIKLSTITWQEDDSWA